MPSERQFPLSSDFGSGRAISIFSEVADAFEFPFSPEVELVNIDVTQAIMTGVKLHLNGYRMLEGAQVSDAFPERTVQKVLDMDVSRSNEAIIDSLRNGGRVGPYLFVEPDEGTPFYSSGVGVWYKEQKLHT